MNLAMHRANVAFDHYAEEAQRRARIENDSLASAHQVALQRHRADEAFKEFLHAYLASRSDKLRLASDDGRAVI